MAKNLALLEVLHTQFPVEMNIFPLTRISLCIKFYFRETLYRYYDSFRKIVIL